MTWHIYPNAATGQTCPDCDASFAVVLNALASINACDLLRATALETLNGALETMILRVHAHTTAPDADSE